MASISFSDRIVRVALRISGARDCGTINSYPDCDSAIEEVFKNTTTHRVSSLTLRNILFHFDSQEDAAVVLSDFVQDVQRVLRRHNVDRAAESHSVVNRPRRSRSEVITREFSRPPIDWKPQARATLTETEFEEDPFQSRPLISRETRQNLQDFVVESLFPRPSVSPISTADFENVERVPELVGSLPELPTSYPRSFDFANDIPETDSLRHRDMAGPGENGFSEAQMRAIETLIARGLETVCRSNVFQTAAAAAARNAIEEERTAMQPQNQNVNTNGRINSTEGVGIFWPDCAGDGLIITRGNETVFKDVVLFCERIVSLVPIKGQAVMKSMVEVLLRGEAMAWWTLEVSEIDKLAIRSDASDNLLQFTTRVKARFTGNCSVAQQSLVTNQYTINDVRGGKRIGTWFDTMIRYGEIAGLTAGRPRLIAIWNALSPTLRTLVDYPGETTTVGQYRAHLEVKYLSWESLELSKGNVKNAVSDNKGKGTYRSYNAQRSSSGWTPTYSGPRPGNQDKVITAQGSGTTKAVTVKPRFPNTDGRPPPGPCKCGGMHWMKDCPILSVAKRVYHGAVEQAGIDGEIEEEPGKAENANEDDDDYYPFADDEEMESFHGSASPVPGIPPALSLITSTGTLEQQKDAAMASMAKFVSMKSKSSVFHINVEKIPHKCPQCPLVAASKRKLKLHQTCTGHLVKNKSGDQMKLVESTSSPVLGTGYEFRKYNYAELVVRTTEAGEDNEVCADSGCGMSLVDEGWAKKNFGDDKFARRPTSVNVRGLGNTVHISQLYLVATLFVPCRDNVIAKVTRELHVVDSLGCNALLGNDILVPERVILDLGSKTATFGCCDGAVAELRIRGCAGRQMDCRAVRCSKTTRIPAQTEGVLPVKFRNFSDRDVEFIPEYTEKNAFMAAAGHMLRGVCNSTTKNVVFRNTSRDDVIVHNGMKLGILRDFHETTKTFHVACGDPSYDTLCDLATEGVWGSRSFHEFGGVSMRSEQYIETRDAFKSSEGGPSSENVANGVDINNSKDITAEQSEALRTVVTKYPSLWNESNDVIDEAVEDWLEIPLIPGAELKPRLPYRLSRRDEQIINETHDRLHREGKMSWGLPGTQGWPCFVVWDHKNPMVKWTKNEEGAAAKPRVVVDIRGLNAAVSLDSYPLPRQDDVINLLKNCQWISTFDLTASFFQRRVVEADRWKLGVISHRGVEVLHVAPMGFKNSAQHMQRLMDKVLRNFPFARCYVDDIVVFSRTFDEHIKHLSTVLAALEKLKFGLNARKCHVGYAEAKLLGHLVDRFGLSTLEERNEAMRMLSFPKTLGELETLLGMFGYYRHFVPNYSQHIDPLQKLKTRLLRGSPRSGRERKVFASKIKLDPPTQDENNAFETIKTCLSNKQTLRHFDPEHELLIYVDASKDNGFAAALHQNTSDGSEYPILYLSKMLNSAEKNYWPTELEIAGIVWVVMKVRHLVEDCDSVVLITDHQAALDIFKQVSLKTSSPDRANLRLVRASLYLSQFVGKLKLRYKPGVEHKNADALSRLRRSYPQNTPEHSTTKEKANETTEVFDVFYSTANSYLKISDELRKRISTGYAKDVTFAPILKRLIEGMAKPNKEKPAVPPVFSLVDSEEHPLIVFRDGQTREHRLCISRPHVSEILQLCHEKKNHPGVDKTYGFVRGSYYFRGLRGAVVEYIRNCKECQKNKPDRTRPYGELKPIETPPVPFHTICMDFIVKLPISNKFDSILTVTDKLSKAKIFCPGKEEYTASQWAHVWWERVYPWWGLPTVMITDRDKIFTSTFWMELFKLARVESALTTAYNPRADGQSENTNMMLEIALRHLVNARHDDWAGFLGELQLQFNNTPNVSTNMTPNQILMGVTLRDIGDIWQPNHGNLVKGIDRTTTEFATSMANIRNEVIDSIRFATYFQKLYFDKKHQPLPSFKPGDLVRLRYAKKAEPGYHSEAPSKLGPLYSSPYEIVRKVSPWAYELSFPEGARIHPVVSVALLKEFKSKTNMEEPETVIIPQQDSPAEVLYEVDAIVGKRYAGKGRKSLEYRVKWKNIDKSEWEPVENLEHCPEAIEEYENSLNNKVVVYKKKGKN